MSLLPPAGRVEHAALTAEPHHSPVATHAVPFSIELLNRYDGLFPGSAQFTAGSACTGTYRALKLWEAAVAEAGSLDQGDVVAALDHARIAEGPGGPAEMVPGQHHVRMNMYIARAEHGRFTVVKSLGRIDPKECEVDTV